MWECYVLSKIYFTSPDKNGEISQLLLLPCLTWTNNVLHGEALVAIGGDEEDVWVLQVRGRLQDLVEGDVAVEADHDGAHLRVQTDVVQAAVEHVTLHDVRLGDEST